MLGESKFGHRFGGAEWTATGPLDEAYGPPILILTLDVTDPRLASLKLTKKDSRSLPLFSYVNGMVETPQRYTLDHTCRTATFVDAEPLSGTIEPLDLYPKPLPQRSLELRKMTPSELPTSEKAYWKACDTLCGRDNGWLRVGGSPLWLYGPERHTTTDGKPMKYVAAVGYDVNPNSPFLDDPEMLMFGDMAYYLFVSKDLSEVVVTYQST